MRFVVTATRRVSGSRAAMALSPDGQHLAPLITIDDKGRTQLWVRSMNSEIAQRVAESRWRHVSILVTGWSIDRGSSQTVD